MSRYQKGKTDLDFTEAGVSEWHWNQLGRIHEQSCIFITSQSQHSKEVYTYFSVKTSKSLTRSPTRMPLLLAYTYTQQSPVNHSPGSAHTPHHTITHTTLQAPPTHYTHTHTGVACQSLSRLRPHSQAHSNVTTYLHSSKSQVSDAPCCSAVGCN